MIGYSAASILCLRIIDFRLVSMVLFTAEIIKLTLKNRMTALCKRNGISGAIEVTVDQ